MTAWPERLVLLGHPLNHSLSPVFQNAALRAAGIQARYEALDVPRSALEDTLAALRRERSAGNVTIPYKRDVYDACDRLTMVAKAVGAVNTFWTAVDGALVGDNTDVGGFQSAVAQLVPDPADACVAILGAGGAAAAVLHALKGWPNVRVRVYSRSRANAEQMVQHSRMVAAVVETSEAAVRDATLVVNATPVGMRASDGSPVPVEAIPATAAVFDAVYRAGETSLVREARARGLRAMDGLTMLIEQGALAFERWFGRFPDRDVMWSAIDERR